MPDYLNRMINEALYLPSNVVLKSIELDEEGRFWMLSNGELLSVCRNQPRYKHFHDNGNGYYYTEINGKKYYLHRLLAITFNEDEQKKRILDDCEVHHLDRNKENNDLGNLAIVSKEKHKAIHKLWRMIDEWEQTQGPEEKQ